MKKVTALPYPRAAVRVPSGHFWGVVKEGTQSRDDPSSDGERTGCHGNPGS